MYLFWCCDSAVSLRVCVCVQKQCQGWWMQIHCLTASLQCSVKSLTYRVHKLNVCSLCVVLINRSGTALPASTATHCAVSEQIVLCICSEFEAVTNKLYKFFKLQPLLVSLLTFRQSLLSVTTYCPPQLHLADSHSDVGSSGC